MKIRITDIKLNKRTKKVRIPDKTLDHRTKQNRITDKSYRQTVKNETGGQTTRQTDRNERTSD